MYAYEQEMSIEDMKNLDYRQSDFSTLATLYHGDYRIELSVECYDNKTWFGYLVLNDKTGVSLGYAKEGIQLNKISDLPSDMFNALKKYLKEKNLGNK